MKSESDFKAELVRQIRTRGDDHYAQRHEDKFAPGVLDLAIKFPGHPHVLAEGKLVRHQSFAPTEAQREKGKRYIAAGGVCALIGWDPVSKQMFIHEWAEEAKKATSFTGTGDYAEQFEEWLRARQ